MIGGVGGDGGREVNTVEWAMGGGGIASWRGRGDVEICWKCTRERERERERTGRVRVQGINTCTAGLLPVIFRHTKGLFAENKLSFLQRYTHAHTQPSALAMHTAIQITG